MNKTMPARCATPLLATANEYQTPDTVFSKEFQDLCSFAMDQALVIEKASQATAASLNSYAIDFYKSSLWFAPAFNDLLDMAAQNLAFCMELQMNWLTLLTPYASSMASNSGNQVQATGDELARSMDVAIGERFAAPGSTVMSVSNRQIRPTLEVSESAADIAMRARAA